MAKVSNPYQRSKPSKTINGKSLQPLHSRSSAIVAAPFALTSDGQVLINVAMCDGRDLEGRALFTGVLMTRGEMKLARKVVDDGIHGAAAKVAAKMPARSSIERARCCTVRPGRSCPKTSTI